jgi:tetratricopeptide (TPR) repeat protein/SAM-dependent methyltransferase
MNRKDRRAAGKQSGVRSADGPFALAVRHHQAGQLLQAESLYRQVLAADRKHFGSLHHLGILALQRGQPQAALDPISRALAVDDRVPECHYNMAFALQQVGRLPEAAAHYRKALALKSDYTDAHTNLGNVLTALGNHAEAAGCYERVVIQAPTAEAHYNLGSALARLGRLDEAVAQFERALALKGDLVGAHNNLANALVAQGRPEQALAHFERALALDPRLPAAHANYGTVLLGLGRLDAAAAALERALAIAPDFADAHTNLGNVLLAQGRLAEAEQRYRRALALDGNLVEARNNLGIVLAARGEHAEAVQQFQAALARKPSFLDGYNNLARAFLSLGQPDHALGALRRALAIGEMRETKSLFVQCVRAMPVLPDHDDFRALMVRALSEPWGRGNDLAAVAARMVTRDPALEAAIARVIAAWPRRLPLAELDPAALRAQPLLRCLMETAAITDVALERLLTSLRAALLDQVGNAREEPELLELCCALARQCFLNEHVFAVTEAEQKAAERLRDETVAAIASGGTITELRLALLAGYFPLHALPGAERLLQRSWPAPLAALLTQQVREPMEERELRAAMPALTPVADEVSRAVRQQYEENPYPRWEKSAPPGPPLAFDQDLRRKLPSAVFHNLEKGELDILIAGCGTGQHAIETAQRFSGCRVLAIDLSLTSLAYAARKSRALGRDNIAYGQADILALGALGRSFDVIEASGVLHHLGDPLAGWRVLASLLRPGGFMMVGLYSEIARAEIIAARAFIAERGYASTAAAIRQCRQDIIDEGRFKDIAASADFFSISGCRDLLFHVQEHRFTLPQIATFLQESSLAFVGFELDPVTPGRYLARFPHDQTMSDLASWDAYEREHPMTFSGMYQFWVQKPR